VNEVGGGRDFGRYQIGLRVLMAIVTYVAMVLGILRVLYPVSNLAQFAALAISLGAVLRPIYTLIRASLDEVWYEDACIESGILSRGSELWPDLGDLSLYQFCALCLVSSVLGAVLVLVLFFLFLCVVLVAMLFS
jgi:hypothetical protein